MSPTTFKVVVAYDGTGFVGWQRQARGTSIQGVIEDALAALVGADVAVHGAGRTDAGVHALGQVASFTLDRNLDAATVLRAANARLPQSVRIVDAAVVEPTFHARHSARAKTYVYRIANGRVTNVFERAYSWQIAEALDVEAMQAAARQLEGRHDFAAFQASGASTITTDRRVRAIAIDRASSAPDCLFGVRRSRGVELPAAARAEVITVEIRGDGFLRHMVRIIVGSLVEIGRGRRDAAWLERVLLSRDRTLAGPTAPASGLFLMGVSYTSDVLADEC